MSQIKTISYSGLTTSTLRMDLIISIKNYSVYRHFLDLLTHNTSNNAEVILQTAGAITGLLTQNGKVSVKTFCADRTFSLAEYYAFRVPDQMEYEVLRLFREDQTTKTLHVLSTEDNIDYIPPSELPLQIYGKNKKSSYYLFPLIFAGDHNALVALEKFISEVACSESNLKIVQDFVQGLPLCSLIKRTIPTSFIGLIPPNISTLDLVKRRMMTEERTDQKKKDQE